MNDLSLMARVYSKSNALAMKMIGDLSFVPRHFSKIGKKISDR